MRNLLSPARLLLLLIAVLALAAALGHAKWGYSPLGFSRGG